MDVIFAKKLLNGLRGIETKNWNLSYLSNVLRIDCCRSEIDNDFGKILLIF